MVKVSLLLLTFGIALSCGAPNLSQTRHFLLPLQHGVYNVQKQYRENEITTNDNSEEDTTELTDLTDTTKSPTYASSTSVSSSILISTSSETTPDSTSASKIETSSTTELTSMSETPSTESIISSTVSPSLMTLLTTLISESPASQFSSSESSTSDSSISESSTDAPSTESSTFYSTISVSPTSHSSISPMESTTEVLSATTTQDPITETSMETTASTESSIDTTSKISTELPSSVSPSTPSLPTTITPKPSNDKEVFEQTKTILQEIQAQYNTLLDHLNKPAKKTLVSSRLNRDNDECNTDICKSLTDRMDLIEDRVDDVDSWTLQENELVDLQTDSEELTSKVEEAIADDDFLDDATFMKDEIEEHRETIETAIKEVEAKISELDNNNNDDDEDDDIVLIAVLGTLSGLLVLGLVGGAIYMFIIKPKKRGRDVKKSYSDDTDANVSKPGQTNLPTTSSSNANADKKLSPSDSDDSFSSDSEAEEITSVTITTTGGGTLGNQQQMISSTGTNTLVPISEL